jgi:hypothetical protein
MKPILAWSTTSARMGTVVAPIVALAAAAAHAQAEAPAASVPGQVAYGVVQAITHEGNVYRAPPGASQDDWLSTTALELRADQPLGGGRWRGEMSLRAHRYAEQHELDSNDHRAALVLDFRAIPQLSGTVGAHTRRQRHHDGIDTATFHFVQPIETEQAAHVLTQWGSPEDGVLLAGADAVERRYDQAVATSSDNLRQHSVEAGLGWGLGSELGGVLRLRRTFIDRRLSIVGDGGDVERQEAELQAQWQATPASRLRMRLAHVQENRDALGDRSFWTGGVAWDWEPASTLRLRAEAFRDTEGLSGPQDPFDADTRFVRAGDVRRDGLRWTTQWAASAATHLLASARLSARQLNMPVGWGHPKDRTVALSIGVRHSPWRSLELGCGLTHEKREANADSQGSWRSSPYEAASVGCQLAWWHR